MKSRYLYLLWTFCVAVACNMSIGSSAAQTAPESNSGTLSEYDSVHLTWRETSLNIEDNIYRWCFDRAHNGVLLAATGVGTVAYNWVNGTRTLLNSQPFSVCASSGRLYAEGPTTIFSLDDPVGRRVERLPTHFAKDGSAQVYWFQPPVYPTTTGLLLASSDGGVTWEERGGPFEGQIVNFAMASADAQSIYVLVKEKIEYGEPYTDNLSGATFLSSDTILRIYFSWDAGKSWEKRGSLKAYESEDRRYFPGDFATMRGRDASVDLIQATFHLRARHSNGGAYNHTWLSGDGGNSFGCAICYYAMDSAPVQLFSTSHGLISLYKAYGDSQLNLSIDSGQHWIRVPIPDGYFDYYVSVDEDHPFVVHLTAEHKDRQSYTGYISFDGAQTWRIVESGDLQFLPYWPLRAYRLTDHRLLLADMPGSEQMLRAAVTPNYAPGGTYFLTTEHNLWGAFRRYWDANEGACKFGSPLSEVVPVASPEGGRVYLAQEFERVVLKLPTGYIARSDEVLMEASRTLPEQGCGTP